MHLSSQMSDEQCIKKIFFREHIRYHSISYCAFTTQLLRKINKTRTYFLIIEIDLWVFVFIRVNRQV